jgi:hypothetical protein
MSSAIFKDAARERMVGLFGAEGVARFELVDEFVQIAARHPGVPLVVPSHIDPDLHEILGARGEDGLGFETRLLAHHSSPVLGETVGTLLEQLDHPTAKQTVQILRSAGFELTGRPYQAPACTLTILP